MQSLCKRGVQAYFGEKLELIFEENPIDSLHIKFLKCYFKKHFFLFYEMRTSSSLAMKIIRILFAYCM
jgi:hypothetical protein